MLTAERFQIGERNKQRRIKTAVLAGVVFPDQFEKNLFCTESRKSNPQTAAFTQDDFGLILKSQTKFSLFV